MSGHTPGPWEQHGNEIIGAMGTSLAFVVCKLTCGTISPAPIFSYLDGDMAEHEDVVNANAAVLKAAPDLLEALEQAARVLENAAHLLVLSGLVDTAASASRTAVKARTAIAKAEPKS